MQSPTSTQQGIGKELLADAKGVGSSAVDKLHSQVDARKGDAATQVKSLSSAIDRAADGLDADAPAWLKSAITQGAQQVQKFADALEQKDSRQLVGDVTTFARNSPGTFLAACAAAGFAASRIFQAGSSANAPNQPAPIGMDNDLSASSSEFASTSSAPSPSPVSGQFA